MCLLTAFYLVFYFYFVAITYYTLNEVAFKRVATGKKIVNVCLVGLCLLFQLSSNSQSVYLMIGPHEFFAKKLSNAMIINGHQLSNNRPSNKL